MPMTIGSTDIQFVDPAMTGVVYEVMLKDAKSFTGENLRVLAIADTKEEATKVALKDHGGSVVFCKEVSRQSVRFGKFHGEKSMKSRSFPGRD